MKLGTKIILAALGAVILSVAVGLVVQRHVIRNQGIELTRNTMRSVILEAENVRESISSLNKLNAFDKQALINEYKKSGDLRNSTIYQTIPVVAAWKAIDEAAQKEGYQFRIPKQQARNPKNNPTAEELEILRRFEDGKSEEYFNVDSKRNEIVYARAIVLTADCLTCHGDPKHSPTGDGKDIVGFQMEDWKTGEVHGAFLLKSSLARVDGVVRASMFKTVSWILPVAALIAAGFYFLNRFLIVRPLVAAISSISASSEQTVGAATEVADASHSLAEGASQQAASLEEASASLEELSSMTKRNAQNAQNANALARQACESAERGTEGVQAMARATEAIKASSDDIAKIIKTIDEIAFQTNILALNAAVEAARAGESGMGFAVVADEVRNLAQRSAQAAKETTSKIEGAIFNTARGVETSAQVVQALNEILGKARQVDQLAAEVANASEQQTMGIAQLNGAVSQMDKGTQANAAHAEETASVSAELNAQAAVMKASVAELLSLVGGEINHRQSAPQFSKSHDGQAPHSAAGAISDIAGNGTPRHRNGAAAKIPLERTPNS